MDNSSLYSTQVAPISKALTTEYYNNGRNKLE